MLRDLLARVELHADRLDLHLLPSRLFGLLRGEADRAGQPPIRCATATAPLILSVPVSLRRAGREMALVVGAEPGAPPTADPAMLRLILRAREIWGAVQRGNLLGSANSRSGKA